LSQYTSHLRTYSSTESPSVPQLAVKYGSDTCSPAPGLIGRNSEIELQALIVRRRTEHRSRHRRQQSLLRQDLSPNRADPDSSTVRAPRSSSRYRARPVGIWLRNRKLVKRVDFITVHLFAVLERCHPAATRSSQRAERTTTTCARVIRQTHPDRRNRLAVERRRHEYAQPRSPTEAQFLRSGLCTADLYSLDYYIEAFDQPWKEAGEGRVGAYWGHRVQFDRQPKFPLTRQGGRGSGGRGKLIGSLLGLGPDVLVRAPFHALQTSPTSCST
jgi:hypothetical protein